MSNNRKLRTGYTTGACAAAAAKAAFSSFSCPEQGRRTSNCNSSSTTSINILFPDSKYYSLPIESCEIRKNGAVTATIIKDAGDDPDITHKAKISATISTISEIEIGTHDYDLKCEKARIILRGGEGVGYSTRIGPDVPVGKWAINPVPRKMIIENLQEAGCGKELGTWLVVISIANGVKLAEKTLNPTIGIIGGLSILGTTGIVEPKSHAAYIETIKILLKGIAENNHKNSLTAVFCTGARTQRAVAADYPELPEHAFIRIGDFIAESMKLADQFHFDKTIVACMPGKLVKYAEGFENTHAHKVKLKITALEPALKFCKIPDEICKKVLSSLTIREALECLTDDYAQHVLDFIGRKALENIKKWCPKATCEIRIYDYHGNLLGKFTQVLSHS